MLFMSKSLLFRLCVIGALVLGFSSLKAADMKVDLAKLPPAMNRPGLTYEKDIKPILTDSCLKCHGPQKPKSRYRVDSLGAIVKAGGTGEAAVVPGDSLKSPLFLYIADAVEDMEMPPLDTRDRYPALSKEQIGIVRAWIDQGAK
jgi:hypothetical protein